MNVTLTSQQIKSENTEISSENDKLIDDDEGENDNKSNIEFNYEHLKVGDDNADNDDDEVNKVQNSETIMPQDLRKCDTVLKHYKQLDYNVENSNLERSPKSPWQHCDGGYVDEDVYTVSAAGQTLPNSLQITSIDGFFNRKRGRPPKNRFVEVYKNTHQKPQAIFTSFKLEKHENSDTATNYENSLNYRLQSGDVTVKGCDNDEKTLKYPRHKPNINSTHRKRLNKVNMRNMILSTISGQNNSLEEVSKEPHLSCEESNDDNYINSAKNSHKDLNPFNEHFKSPEFLENADCDDNDISKSINSETMPAAKKTKFCGTTDQVTVVRAAGTFYPENSHGDCKAYNNRKEKISDNGNNGKGGGEFLGKEELKSSSASYKDNNMAQNLSLKDSLLFNTDSLETPTLPLLTTSSSVLPQIYNVLQMQQQLFAFYHQMALMTPAFSHLDLKSLFIPTLTQTTATALSSPSSSTSSVTPVESDLPLHNKKDLVNMILSLKRQQLNQKNVSDELQNMANTQGRVPPLHKRAMSSTITSGTGRGNISKHIQNSAEETQDISRTITPVQKLSEAQFSYAKRTPSGYLRFRFNEDCGYKKCGYRQHQSHFHCNRVDCQYSFCDKTRFVQHTARHERLDTLMGSDFQQYRATMTCNYSNCPYDFNSSTEDSNDILNGRKSSHFHCLKCPFVCVDTNKVVAHRRLHKKMEFIRLAGFRKVTSYENCMYSCTPSSSKTLEANENISLDIEISESDKNLAVQNDTVFNNHLTTDNDLHCPYAMRHAHYHCLTCNCSVLSRSQLLAHKHRNVGILHTPQPSESATLLSSKDKSN